MELHREVWNSADISICDTYCTSAVFYTIAEPTRKRSGELVQEWGAKWRNGVGSQVEEWSGEPSGGMEWGAKWRNGVGSQVEDRSEEASGGQVW